MFDPCCYNIIIAVQGLSRRSKPRNPLCAGAVQCLIFIPNPAPSQRNCATLQTPICLILPCTSEGIKIPGAQIGKQHFEEEQFKIEILATKIENDLSLSFSDSQTYNSGPKCWPSAPIPGHTTSSEQYPPDSQLQSCTNLTKALTTSEPTPYFSHRTTHRAQLPNTMSRLCDNIAWAFSQRRHWMFSTL